MNAAAAGALQAVLLTPAGRGAVASILVQGAGAVDAVERCLQLRGGASLSRVPPSRIVLGVWQTPGHARTADGSLAGEEVVTCRRSDEEIELHCHGGQAASRAILAALEQQGCLVIQWQAWSTQECDPIAAEALIALSGARTERTAALLLDQYHGALTAELRAIDELLQQKRVEEAAARLTELEQSSATGLHLVEPFGVVLAGRPNVGKSSLINALVGYERAIVFDQPGTTRDVVTAATALDGWPVELSDTAGLRESDDALEAAGIELARQRLEEADLIVLVHEASSWDAADASLAAQWPAALHVRNKCDLVNRNDLAAGDLCTSAILGEGIEELASAIATRLVPKVREPGQPLVFTPQQLTTIRASASALAASDLAGARAGLRTLLGSP